ncbi:daptide-type RiPP [Nonomuraea sp. PA05]|uniref:daptide-type RiPP n=1 Tax=Nonomuraea sp. PA05 TaxID=2604466 RepID=UPI00292A3E8B|nr:daptide-type RiPP [Nonomuraea sp. PA05]
MNMAATSSLTPALELGMQELEAMDAPGFWSGFKQGVVITVGTLVFASAIASAAAT